MSYGGDMTDAYRLTDRTSAFCQPDPHWLAVWPVCHTLSGSSWPSVKSPSSSPLSADRILA
jgi:hypothetical protein